MAVCNPLSMKSRQGIQAIQHETIGYLSTTTLVCFLVFVSILFRFINLSSFLYFLVSILRRYKSNNIYLAVPQRTTDLNTFQQNLIFKYQNIHKYFPNNNFSIFFLVNPENMLKCFYSAKNMWIILPYLNTL